MFPDPDIKWIPFPSEMDGMRRGPFVLDRGFWKGVLHLMVLEGSPGTRAYGVQIDCEVYAAFEEMIHSVASHGDVAGAYDGTVYIKEAMASSLLSAYANIDPFERKPRHFLFVSIDFCYECLSFEEPIIRTFATQEEAYRWGPAQED